MAWKQSPDHNRFIDVDDDLQIRVTYAGRNSVFRAIRLDGEIMPLILAAPDLQETCRDLVDLIDNWTGPRKGLTLEETLIAFVVSRVRPALNRSDKPNSGETVWLNKEEHTYVLDTVGFDETAGMWRITDPQGADFLVTRRPSHDTEDRRAWRAVL